MIHGVASLVGNYICTINRSDEDTTEVVIYAIEVLLSYIITFINIIICCYIVNIFFPLHNPLVSILIFIFGLVSIRKYFGGYHADSNLSCMIISITVTIICIILGQIINFNSLCIIVSYILCYIIGVKFGTQDNPNKRLTEEEKKMFKSKGLISIKLLFILNMVFYYLRYYEASDVLLIAVLYGFINLFFSK
jgi:accessory gene regulator B